MPKRFKVTVTEIGEEVRTIGKQWERGAEGDPDKFGYTPETQATRPYERDVYQQTVSELNMSALVMVVNQTN